MEKRKRLIKSKLALIGLNQTQAAKEIGISTNAMIQYTKGAMNSQKIDNWIKGEFGEDFLKELQELQAS